MKSTGMTRKVDELGRIVIPIEIRRTFDIVKDDALEICVEGDSIILTKCAPNCTFCGSTKDIFIFKGKNICPQCLADLKK